MFQRQKVTGKIIMMMVICFITSERTFYMRIDLSACVCVKKYVRVLPKEQGNIIYYKALIL